MILLKISLIVISKVDQLPIFQMRISSVDLTLLRIIGLPEEGRKEIS